MLHCHWVLLFLHHNKGRIQLVAPCPDLLLLSLHQATTSRQVLLVEWFVYEIADMAGATSVKPSHNIFAPGWT